MDSPPLDPKIRRAMLVREIFTGEIYLMLWRIEVKTLGQLEDTNPDGLSAKGMNAIEISKVISACQSRGIELGGKKTTKKTTRSKDAALPGQTGSPPPFRLRDGRKLLKPMTARSIDSLKINSAKRLRKKGIRTNVQLAACTPRMLKEDVGLSDRQIANIKIKLAEIGMSLQE